MKRYWFSIILCLILSACASNPEPTSQPPQPTTTHQPLPTTHHPPPTAPTGNAPSYPAPNEEPAVPAPLPTATYASNGYPGFWTPIPSAVALPLCNYTLTANFDPITPTLNTFSFSEPTIMLTNTETLRLHEWLPDSNQLLLSHVHHNNDHLDYIETFDIVTGDTKRYAESYGLGASSIWLPEQQGVIYYEREDEAEIAYTIKFSTGLAESTTSYTTGKLSTPTLNPFGDLIFFDGLAGDPAQQLNLTTAVTQASPIDPAQWRSTTHPNPEERNYNFSSLFFSTAWHPTENKVLIYQHPVTFLYDIDQDEVCEIDFGKRGDGAWLSPTHAHWSPNGRYIAFRLSTHRIRGAQAIGIFDLETQTLRLLQPSPEQEPWGVAWMPNGEYVSVLGTSEPIDDIRDWGGLFLIEAETGEIQQVAEAYNVGLSWPPAHVWSPNGQQLAIACPTDINETWHWRLCLFSVSSR